MPHRNIRYRLYPKTRAKADLLNQCLGATRFVWNHFLAKNKTMMQAHRDDASNPLPSTSFFLWARSSRNCANSSSGLIDCLAHPFVIPSNTRPMPGNSALSPPGVFPSSSQNITTMTRSLSPKVCLNSIASGCT